MNWTKNSTYLSNMKLERRNAPEAIQLLFCSREYGIDEFYDKPTAELFAEITSEHLKFKHDGDDLIFRETIRTVDSMTEAKKTVYRSQTDESENT